jgi:hypothetical protein
MSLTFQSCWEAKLEAYWLFLKNGKHKKQKKQPEQSTGGRCQQQGAVSYSKLDSYLFLA